MEDDKEGLSESWAHRRSHKAGRQKIVDPASKSQGQRVVCVPDLDGVLVEIRSGNYPAHQTGGVDNRWSSGAPVPRKVSP